MLALANVQDTSHTYAERNKMNRNTVEALFEKEINKKSSFAVRALPASLTAI